GRRTDACPATSGEKPPGPAPWPSARKGESAPAARGNSGATSDMTRLMMPRAGRPVMRLVNAVASSRADLSAARCGAEIFASGHHRYAVGQRMSEDWGQPVLIENRAGGNTAIGAQAAARLPPAGYTLLGAMEATMVLNPLVKPNLPYDPLNDFAPISLLIKTVALVVVRSDGPKTIKELIAKAKANPGKLNMGAGTITSRLGALQFAKSAEIV